MKLQPALLFGEHMLLQREQPIPVWGRSANGDTVTVTLNGAEKSAQTVNGTWCVTFDALPAMERTSMTIESARTGEKVTFSDVAIGEVWLAGGQSNMEFLLKYDIGAEEMRKTPADEQLRYFRYPQTSFLGNLERDTFPDDGFWRRWNSTDNINFFSAPAAYMGRALRKVLGVPVGFIGCNWGGTPAVAWADMELIKANPALQPVLDWHADVCAKLDWQKYEADALVPEGEMSLERKVMDDALMMGGDSKVLFAKYPMKMPEGYSPFTPGPKAAIRPAGLYEQMMKHIAPYAVRGAVWYQGEDDDARGWQAFYDESMKSTINSWRGLWKRQLPFFQVELAPLDEGLGKALQYPCIREKQRAVMDTLADVHNVCIMDAGDAHNIHVRNKKPVGERLALLARKYVYGEADLLADSPRAESACKNGGEIFVRMKDAGDGLVLRHNGHEALTADVDGELVTPEAEVHSDTVVLRHASFANAKTVTVYYNEQNFCEASIFNSAGLPAFPFTMRITAE